MKRLPYLKQISIFIITISMVLVINTSHTQEATAAPVQTGIESTIAWFASSQVGVQESPLGSNKVPGKGYGSGVAWCAEFVTWVLMSSGINPFANGRGPLQGSWKVARAWAKYGAAGGGYGRWATARDAMPGDLLIDYYDGTANKGGHISIVIESQVLGNRDLVRTIGGNESNMVRNTVKSLGEKSRYLVTLSELRNQHIPMVGGGVVVTSRYWSGYGAISQISSIWDTQTGAVYGSGQLASSPYVVRTQNVFTGATTFFRPDQPIATEIYRNALLIRQRTWLFEYVGVATLTYN